MAVDSLEENVAGNIRNLELDVKCCSFITDSFLRVDL